MPENKHLRFFIYVAYAVLGFFFITKLLPLLWEFFMPFIMAFVVAAIANPVMKLLQGKLKFPKWLATCVSLLLILVILSSILTFAVNRIVVEVTQLIDQLPTLMETVSQQIQNISDQWSLLHERLSPEYSLYLNDAISQATSALMSLLTPLTQSTISGATSLAKRLPTLLIFSVAFILASIFMTGDYDFIKRSLMNQLPKKAQEKVRMIKRYAGIALTKYLKGMGIILLITFTELVIGFTILGVPYAFSLALVTAVVDIFPVFGTGTILLPWCVILLLTGSYRMAISVFVLYVIITVVRQFIEPKVMSTSLGTYPLVTLMAMYIGLKLFGVAGMILGPIAILILIYLQREGVIRFWKESPKLPGHHS